jgi:hypothetical protein
MYFQHDGAPPYYTRLVIQHILTDNTESVSYLLNQHIACFGLNRYIIEYTQQDAKYENEDITETLPNLWIGCSSTINWHQDVQTEPR